MSPELPNLLHRIRLRGPWQMHASQHANSSSGVRVKLPGAWSQLPPVEAGPVMFARRFNRPTGLEATDQLWLAVAEPNGSLSASLNGQPIELPAVHIDDWVCFILGAAPEPHHEIQLTVDPLAAHSEHSQPWSDVELWIVGQA